MRSIGLAKLPSCLNRAGRRRNPPDQSIARTACPRHRDVYHDHILKGIIEFYPEIADRTLLPVPRNAVEETQDPCKKQKLQAIGTHFRALDSPTSG